MFRSTTPDRSCSKNINDDSIFSHSEDPWDHVFENIKDMPPLLPSSARARHRHSPAAPGADPSRRYTMTAREINAFDEMFDMIFNAVSEQKKPQWTGSNPRSISPTLGIGRVRSTETSDLFGKLRQQSRRLKWTTEADEELDRKKEEMELCDTDQQLLEWAMREVFGESQRYEENARRALEDPSSAHEPVQLQPTWYPHIIALLMRTFRESYADPHLALSIFDHARHLSIPSFVFGCTTPAYNELIETRWSCFRDLRGVCEALEEMRVNGIEMDNRTRSLAEMIRLQVGERTLWQEENNMGSGEVWKMVSRIERLTARDLPRSSRSVEQNRVRRGPSKKKWTPDQESWKGRALQDEGTKDGWVFDQWNDVKADQSSGNRV